MSPRRAAAPGENRGQPTEHGQDVHGKATHGWFVVSPFGPVPLGDALAELVAELLEHRSRSCGANK